MEPLSQPTSQLAGPGRTLGRYELLLPLGKGGMAQVWAARLRGTRGFQKIVAIKTILADAMEGSRAEQMFLEEATLASRIHHPNVVQTLELGEQDGTLYLVMEWVNGEPLSQVLHRASETALVPLELAVNMVGQACKGLHAAHEARDEAGELLGIVHRDVSPHNVLVGYDGTVKLVDFGIAKATARTSDLTHQGELKGKFAYMAPEQVSGAVIDRRVDVFGMGVLLYALTTGRHPFRGRSAGETLRNICANAPPLPSSAVEGYPPALEEVVLRALAKSAGDRFATAQELLAALEAAVPESLGSREGELVACLAALFGDRGAARLNELRLTQQQLDPHGQTHGSVSSLRAVSIDHSAPPPSSDALVAATSPPALSQRAVALEPTNRRLLLPFAVTAALSMTALLAYTLGHSPATPRPLPSAALAPKAALALEPTSSAKQASAPLPQPSAQPPVVEIPRPSPRSISVRSGADDKKSTQPREHATAKTAQPLASAGPVALSPPPAGSPTPRPGVEASTPSKVNAWNAENYGGRL